MKKVLAVENKLKITILAFSFCASLTASAEVKIHEEKFPNYFNTGFATTLNSNFASTSGNWQAWSNNSNATVVVVDYAMYSSPCAIKMVNYAYCSGTGAAVSQATSPTINLLPHLSATTLKMDFYVFSYEAVSDPNTKIAIEFYNGAANNWVVQWVKTGSQFNNTVGLNAWKTYSLNIPVPYRRADFKYRIVGTMNPGVCGNQYIYFDDFSISSNLNLLPTEVSFNAQKQDNGNLLQWTNYNEGGNRDYTVERSADGRNFSALGSVTAQSGTGAKQYNFTDRAPLSGINYYRLAIHTLAGDKVYSAVKVVLQNSRNTQASAFPNPAKEFTNINIPQNWQQGSVIIQIAAADGRIVWREKREQAAATEWLNLQKLNAGLYRILLQNPAGGETQGISFVKQ